MQVETATVECGNQYSVVELAQHQECMTLLPAPHVTSLFLHSVFYILAINGPSQAGLGWTVIGFGQAELWLRPGQTWLAFFGPCT